MNKTVIIGAITFGSLLLAGCNSNSQKKTIDLTTTQTTVAATGMSSDVQGTTTKGAKLSYTLNSSKNQDVKVASNGKFTLSIPNDAKTQKVKLTAKKSGSSDKTKTVTISAAKPMTAYSDFQSAYNTVNDLADNTASLPKKVTPGISTLINKKAVFKANTTKDGKLLGLSTTSDGSKSSSDKVGSIIDTAALGVKMNPDDVDKAFSKATKKSNGTKPVTLTQDATKLTVVSANGKVTATFAANYK